LREVIYCRFVHHHRMRDFARAHSGAVTLDLAILSR
jgi:hypothetical protein